MGLYVNRIKYKGGSPRLGASSGIINNAIVDGYYFYDDDYQPTPPVIDYSREYFTIISWQDNNTIYIHLGTANNGTDIVNLSYSYDKTTWTTITGSIDSDMTITGVNKGIKIYIKGNNNRLSSDRFPAWETSIHASKKFEVCGNIMSLLWGDNFIGKTVVPNTSDTMCFQNFFESVLIHTGDRANLLSTRNLVLPCTIFNRSMYESFFYNCTGLLYGPKEIPMETSIGGTNALGNFYYGCSSIQETAKINVTTTANSIFNGIVSGASSLKRSIFLTNTGYPSISAAVKYKLSTNTSVSGSSYRDFDTLEAQNAFLSIWAETETPYDGIVGGCSDYFIAGDSVTLTYVAVNGTFNGYYDENDNLLSSSSTYTFTAQRSMKIKVKTT